MGVSARPPTGDERITNPGLVARASA